MESISLGPLHCGFLYGRPDQGSKSQLGRFRAHLHADLRASALPSSGGSLTSLRDQLSFLLRKRCIDVKYKIVDVSAECGHNKVHLVLHQSTDEVDVARQAVELRDYQGAPPELGFSKRCG